MICFHRSARTITQISSPSDFYTNSSVFALALIWECNECGVSVKYLREDLVEEEIQRQIALWNMANKEENPHVRD